MTNNQQLLLGVGVVGLAAFLYHKSKQPKAPFAGVGSKMRNYAGMNAKRNASGGKLKGIRMNADGTRMIAGNVLPLGDRAAFGKKKAGFANQKLSGDSSWVGVDSSKSKFFKVQDKGWVNR
jgi:hypothetical protein